MSDHSEQIAVLRSRADVNRRVGAYDAAMQDALAADLLEMHDDTGLSMDSWPGALNFVSVRLGRAGLSPEIAPNGA